MVDPTLHKQMPALKRNVSKFCTHYARQVHNIHTAAAGPVQNYLKFGVWWAANGKVPLEDIVLQARGISDE